MLEFDSRHGDITSVAGSITSGAGAGGSGAFPWERRRRAGSHGSIDTEYGLADGYRGEGVGEYKMGFDLRDGK